MCLSYAAFYPIARYWLHYLAESSAILADVALKEEEGRAPSGDKQEKWSDFGEIFILLDVFGVIAVFLALFFVFAGIAFSIFWVITEGPVILVDVAFDIALAGGLVRSLRPKYGEGWAGVLFRRTALPFLMILTVNLLVVYWAHTLCPGNDRLSQMFSDCKKAELAN